tara:strand:+ start:2819 stop:3634 length:816 start_codon:yes stop_codon:yes gene_type:complete
MDLNSKDIQLQYQGFLNTPLLWKSDVIFGLKQFEISEENSTTFEGAISKKLRLGIRVERFVSHLLKQYPSIKIIAENIQIQKETTTLGEIDFLLTKNKQPIHLEIIYKFYLFDESVGSTELEHWIGPNRNDSLISKIIKLKEKQLPLLFHSQTKTYLEKLQIKTQKIAQNVYFKAQLFVPYKQESASFDLINNDCVKGFYIQFNELSQFENCKFHIPSKANWLQEVQIQTNWKTYTQFTPKIELLIQNKTSPLCWLKQPNGEVFKIFIIWW